MNQVALEIKNLITWLKQWFYDSDEVDSLLANKQATLVAGSNIKTINNTSILGSGNISISGGGGSFEPELVYRCTNFSSNVNTSATNHLELYKLGSIYFLRYFITTNTLTYSYNEYNLNSDNIPSDYRPSSDVKFHISTSSNHNASIIVSSDGKIRVSADTHSVAISFAGSQTYWWADVVSPVVALSLSSSSVTYGTSVTLSATVTQGGSAVSGETVTFYDGSTSLGTATTNSSGVATLTKSDWSVSNHSLTAVYGSVTSSAETLTVSKATPTISLTASSTTPTYGTSINLVGSLSSLGSGASVKIYDGNNLLDTVTTGTGGAFTCSTSSLTVGSHSLTAVFEGNTNYNSVTSSAVSVVVVSPTPDSVALTSDKSILSYADSESATLSATVLDSSSNPVEGATVEFFKGSTSLGTATTNSSGVATKSYSSTGAGDISFTAEVGSLVSESYEVCDAWDYDSLTSNNNKFSITSGGANVVYDSTGLDITGNQNVDTFYSYQGNLPSTFSIEFEFVSCNLQSSGQRTYSTEFYCKGVELGANYSGGIFYGNGGSLTYTHVNFSAGDLVRLDYDGSTVKMYRNNNLIVSLNKGSSTDVGFKTYNTRNLKVKNMKILPL